MIGQRGAPATFGGVEHHVEELGARLVDRGHRVTVYCRRSYSDERPRTYRGMELRHLRNVPTKHFDAITHSAAAVMHSLGARPDIVHFHALGPGLVSPLAQMFSRCKVVQTVHGLDGDRAKWGKGASRILKLGEKMSASVPDATIVVSHALADHYQERYHRETAVFPNGVSAFPRQSVDELRDAYGLEQGYLLYVGRIVPEKRLDLLLSAYRQMDTERPLVIAGGDSFSSDYLREIRDLAAQDERVLMTGYVYGSRLRALYSNAAVFVLPSELEGMPLTLLEAASFATPIVASDIPPHVEVLGRSRPGARLFHAGERAALVEAIEATLAGEELAHKDASAVRRHVVSNYDWDTMTDQVEALYYELASS